MDRFRPSSAGVLITAATLCLASGDPRWQVFDVKKAELAFSMPQKPQSSQAVLNGQTSFFYTWEGGQGRFVAGYSPIAPSFQDSMKRGIQADPGSTGIMHLLDSTIAALAKDGKSTIVGENCGLDHGLPAEFATLKRGQTTLKVRLYLCSRRVYIFEAAADPDTVSKFFNSVRIPSEVRKPD